MYKIYRNQINGKVCLCSQPHEDVAMFKRICEYENYDIYLDDKKVTSKYKTKRRSKND